MKNQILTKKERTIVRMIVDDCLPVKAVAAELNRSKDTINNQLRGIYRTLNIHSQTELSKKYFKDNSGQIREVAPVIQMFPDQLKAA